MLANLAVALFASGTLAMSLPQPKPMGECTTFVTILIWSEGSDDMFRVTVPVDCSIARAMEYHEPLEEDFSKAPFRFEQRSKSRDWHAIVQMKDFRGKPYMEE